MIERIDLFMPPRSRYEVLHYFTKSFAQALSNSGVRCRVLEAEKDNPQDFINSIFRDPPECTLSFNGLLPDSEGRFFSDLIKIPHIACLVDSAHHFVQLTRSPYSIVTCTDRYACDFFEGLNFHNVIFMPHGVNKELIVPPGNEERAYDVLMLASFTDSEAIRKEWKKTYSPALCEALDEAAEALLSDYGLSVQLALSHALDRQVKKQSGLDPRNINFLLIMDQLDDYITGKDRLALLSSIKDAKIDIFGVDSSRWKSALKNPANIKTHDSVPYEEALKLMRQSKIVLNSCAKIRYGGHERIFAGMASGAVVLSNENTYLHDHFKHRESILFYRNKHMEEINDLVNQYVADPTLRNSVIKKSQQLVLNGHTWDHRAAVLLNALGPILHEIVESVE